METIEYPAGEDPLQLWRIPHGIADKLAPVPAPDDDTEPLLIDVRKRVPAPEMGLLEELTEADLALLRQIWDVPQGWPLPIERACRQSEFAELRRRFDAAPQKPDWSLFAEFSDWAQERRNKNTDLQRKHWMLIDQAIRTGRLHPLTHDRLPAATAGDAALLGVAQARDYLRPLGFDLVEVIPNEVQALINELPQEALHKLDASGQLADLVQRLESAQCLSDILHRNVSHDDVKVRRFESAADMLEALLREHSQPPSAPPRVWALWLALEAAAIRGDRFPDMLHVSQLQHAITGAARKGELRVRTLGTVQAPLDVRPDMPEDELATRVSVTVEDLRAWAAQHWPELASSMVLSKSAEAPQRAKAAERANQAHIANEWTAERVEQARAYRDRLKAQGVKDYTKRTAAKFGGVTEARIRQVLNDKQLEAVWNVPKRPKRGK